MKPTLPLILLFTTLSAFGTGCASERTYQVTVRNDTPGPVTIWLYKDGGPDEALWRSPEDLAGEPIRDDQRIGGRVIGPKAIASAGPISGNFNPDANAVLRVYRGAHGLNELLAISASSPDRIDAKLVPGDNSFLIVDRNSNLALYRVPDIRDAAPPDADHPDADHPDADRPSAGH